MTFFSSDMLEQCPTGVTWCPCDPHKAAMEKDIFPMGGYCLKYTRHIHDIFGATFFIQKPYWNEDAGLWKL